ncbi:hypothetical protein [Rhodosalinus sp. FB01]|uniref:hypothetical protein n=1 Tax=Rhodosalinus sp. FB01 TaxID=3239194 RepID=UPI0035253EEC
MRLHLRLAPALFERAEADGVEAAVEGVLRDGRVDFRERALPVLAAHEIVDEKAPGERRVGVGLDHRARRLEGGHAIRVGALQQRRAVVEVGLDRADQQVLGREVDGHLSVALDLVPVVHLEREAGERAPALEVLGVLLDEAQVVAVGALQVAARLLDVGHEQPRLLVAAVELEDVAQFHEGAGVVTLRVERHGVFVMLSDLLFGGLAGGQGERGQAQDGHECGTTKHLISPCWSTRRVSGGRATGLLPGTP